MPLLNRLFLCIRRKTVEYRRATIRQKLGWNI